jgi:hypothetical protein
MGHVRASNPLVFALVSIPEPANRRRSFVSFRWADTHCHPGPILLANSKSPNFNDFHRGIHAELLNEPLNVRTKKV